MPRFLIILTVITLKKRDSILINKIKKYKINNMSYKNQAKRGK